MAQAQGIAESDFPIDAFPAKVQSVILNMVRHENFKVEYLATAILSATASALGNTYNIRVKGQWTTNAAYALDRETPLAVAVAILMAAGFFIYGPQALVGIAAANIATKRAAATAGGFCGLFGYGSTVVSGWGLGLLVQRTGWNAALSALIGAAVIGTAIFALAWRARPNGYDD